MCTVLKILSLQLSWKVFFFYFFLHWLGNFLTTAKPLIWASFFAKKVNVILLFHLWLFNFNAILKTCFKIYLINPAKNGCFPRWNKSLEPYKLPLKNVDSLCKVIPRSIYIQKPRKTWLYLLGLKFVYCLNVNTSKLQRIISWSINCSKKK